MRWVRNPRLFVQRHEIWGFSSNAVSILWILQLQDFSWIIEFYSMGIFFPFFCWFFRTNDDMHWALSDIDGNASLESCIWPPFSYQLSLNVTITFLVWSFCWFCQHIWILIKKTNLDVLFHLSSDRENIVVFNLFWSLCFLLWYILFLIF